MEVEAQRGGCSCDSNDRRIVGVPVGAELLVSSGWNSSAVTNSMAAHMLLRVSGSYHAADDQTATGGRGSWSDSPANVLQTSAGSHTSALSAALVNSLFCWCLSRETWRLLKHSCVHVTLDRPMRRQESLSMTQTLSHRGWRPGSSSSLSLKAVPRETHPGVSQVRRAASR